jgi:RimJ/RimL family protein N-acetyltransferase
MDYFNQESDRLRFRKLTEEDIPSWVDFFVNNDRLRFLGITDWSKSKETLAEDWIRKQLDRYEQEGFGHLAVELKESGEFIGMGGILPRELKGKTEYEISYSLKPPFWKKGYGTEMAKQMKRFGLKNIDSNRFISIIEVENVDSIHVAKKNGMSALFNTEFLGMDVVVYGLENK